MEEQKINLNLNEQNSLVNPDLVKSEYFIDSNGNIKKKEKFAKVKILNYINSKKEAFVNSLKLNDPLANTASFEPFSYENIQVNQENGPNVNVKKLEAIENVQNINAESTIDVNDININQDSLKTTSLEGFNTVENMGNINNGELVVVEKKDDNNSPIDSGKNEFITNNDLANITFDMDSNLNNNNVEFNFQTNIGDFTETTNVDIKNITQTDEILSEFEGKNIQTNQNLEQISANSANFNISEYPSTKVKSKNNEPVSSVQLNIPLKENFSDHEKYFQNDFKEEIIGKSTKIQNEITNIVQPPTNVQTQIISTTHTPMYQEELTTNKIQPTASVISGLESFQNVETNINTEFLQTTPNFAEKKLTKDSSTQTDNLNIGNNLVNTFESNVNFNEYMNLNSNSNQYDDIYKLIEQNNKNEPQITKFEAPISTNITSVEIQNNNIETPQKETTINTPIPITQTTTTNVFELGTENQNLNLEKISSAIKLPTTTIPMKEIPVTTTTDIIPLEAQPIETPVETISTDFDEVNNEVENINLTQNQDIIPLEAQPIETPVEMISTNFDEANNEVQNINLTQNQDIIPLEAQPIETPVETISTNFDEVNNEVQNINLTQNQFKSPSFAIDQSYIPITETRIVTENVPLETKDLGEYTTQQTTTVETQLPETEITNNYHLKDLPPLEENGLIEYMDDKTPAVNTQSIGSVNIDQILANLPPLETKDFSYNETQISNTNIPLSVTKTQISNVQNDIIPLETNNLTEYLTTEIQNVKAPLPVIKTTTNTISTNTAQIEPTNFTETIPNASSPLPVTETISSDLPGLSINELVNYGTEYTSSINTQLPITETKIETISSNLPELEINNLVNYGAEPITETNIETISSDLTKPNINDLVTYGIESISKDNTPLHVPETNYQTTPLNLPELSINNLTTYGEEPIPTVNSSFPITKTNIETISSDQVSSLINNLNKYGTEPIPTVPTQFPITETSSSNFNLQQTFPITTTPQPITSTTIEPISTNIISPLQYQIQNQQLLSNSYSIPITQENKQTIPQTTYLTSQAQTVQTSTPFSMVNNQITSANTNIPQIEIKSQPLYLTPRTPIDNISLASSFYPTQNQTNQIYSSHSASFSNNLPQTQITQLPPTTIIPETQNKNTLISYGSQTQNIYMPPLPTTQTKPYTMTGNITTNISNNILPLKSQNQSIYIPPPAPLPLLSTSSSYQINPSTTVTTNATPLGIQNQSIYMPQPYSMPLPQNQITTSNIEPYSSQSHNPEIFQHNQLTQSINSQLPYSTFSTQQNINMPNKMRTETEIVPVEEVEYVPVKKLKYVKKTKVFVPKVKKVIVPVPKKVIVPVKKVVYVSKNSSGQMRMSGQYNMNSILSNVSQVSPKIQLQPQNKYSSKSYNYNNLNVNNLPYSSNTEIDNEIEEHAVPIYRKENSTVQFGSPLNPIRASNASFTSQRFFSPLRNGSTGVRNSYIQTQNVYTPRTYRPRSLTTSTRRRN